jgi:hypothetical protein
VKQRYREDLRQQKRKKRQAQGLPKLHDPVIEMAELFSDFMTKHLSPRLGKGEALLWRSPHLLILAANRSTSKI